MTKIRFDNVYYKYHYDDFAVFDGLSFTLDEAVNSVWCDVQCGKGTLCRLLTGELKAGKGQIYFDELPLDGITAAERGILYLTKTPTLFEHKSVLYNVAYPLAVRKVAGREREKAASEALEKLGIAELTKVKTCKLSTDERRLVALARGLTVPRNVVLLDDFFVQGGKANTAFDSFDQNAVFDLWKDATKVVLTADKRLLTGKSVVLDGGKCVYYGDAAGAAECAESCLITADVTN